MLITSSPSGGLRSMPARRVAGPRKPGLWRRTLSAFGRLLAASLSILRASREAVAEADEAGDATLRDLGLVNRGGASPYEMADIDPGLEATRMRLFAMTGQYWRGS